MRRWLIVLLAVVLLALALTSAAAAAGPPKPDRNRDGFVCRLSRPMPVLGGVVIDNNLPDNLCPPPFLLLPI